MSEIEKAIEHYKEMVMEFKEDYPDGPAVRQLLNFNNLAIQALQEKTERDNPKPLVTNKDGDVMLCPHCSTDLMGEFTEPEGEKYCPFCGGAVDFYKTACDRKLVEE